eukprot:64031-Rhodomonas_salina.2
MVLSRVIAQLANFQFLLTRCAGMGADKCILEDPFGLPCQETVPDVPVGVPVEVVKIDQDNCDIAIHIPGAVKGKEKKKKPTAKERAEDAEKKKH